MFFILIDALENAFLWLQPLQSSNVVLLVATCSWSCAAVKDNKDTRVSNKPRFEFASTETEFCQSDGASSSFRTLARMCVD